MHPSNLFRGLVYFGAIFHVKVQFINKNEVHKCSKLPRTLLEIILDLSFIGQMALITIFLLSKINSRIFGNLISTTLS